MIIIRSTFSAYRDLYWTRGHISHLSCCLENGSRTSTWGPKRERTGGLVCVFTSRDDHWKVLCTDLLSTTQLQSLSGLLPWLLLCCPARTSYSHPILTESLSGLQKCRKKNALVTVIGHSLCPWFGLLTRYCWPAPGHLNVSQVQLTLRLKHNKSTRTGGDQWMCGLVGGGCMGGVFGFFFLECLQWILYSS